MPPGRSARGLFESRIRDRPLSDGHQARLLTWHVRRELVGEALLRDVEIMAAVRERDGRRERRSERASRKATGQAARGFALVRRERGDEYQRRDVPRVPRRGANDAAPVGMTDQDDRPRHGTDRKRDICRVAAYTAKRIRERDDVMAGVEQKGCDAVPAGRIGEGAVHEDNRRAALRASGSACDVMSFLSFRAK